MGEPGWSDTLTPSQTRGEGKEKRASAVFPRGTMVGRYMLLRVLGEGGMGVVYEAFDPELDRRVALKLVGAERTGSDSQAALVAEARALANLSHPNVVSAFDVGVANGQVFVAMELVEGLNLNAWLKERARSRGQILEVLLAAGRGLVASHAAGIIHRDFKPDNVVIGKDGRVRVIDFGLAMQEPKKRFRPEELSAAPEPSVSEEVRGTPGFMSLEQLYGDVVDEATDQFAFAATLYQALYGVPAFSGRTWVDLTVQMHARSLTPPPDGHKIPPWLHRIAVRGLAPKKEDRFASLPAMLDALSNDPQRVFRVGAKVAAATTAAVLSVALLSSWYTRRLAQCRGTEIVASAVWDQPRRDATQAAFARSGRLHASATFERVDRLIAGWVNAWTAMRIDACEATRRRAEQSEELLDLRMACLDRALVETRSLTEALEKGEGAVIDDAVVLANRLRPLDRCADAASLRAAYPLPSDPEARARVAALDRRTSDLSMLERVGDYAAVSPLVAELAEAAAKEAYPPSEAKALGLLAAVSVAIGEVDRGEKALHAALGKAALSHDDDLVAEFALYQLYMLAQLDERAKEASAIAPLVSATVARARGDSGLDAQEMTVLGLMRQRQGSYPEAEAYFQEALALYRRRLGDDHPDIANALNNLGAVYDDQGRTRDALHVYEDALALVERALGADSPRAASILNNTGLAHLSLGAYDKAEAELSRSLSIWEGTYGPEHAEVALTLNNLGLALTALGRLPEAEMRSQRSLELKEKIFGPEHPSLAYALEALGTLANKQGRHTKALALCQRAQAVVEHAYGSTHPNTAYGLHCAGVAASALGRHAQAVKWLEQALKLRESDGSVLNRAETRLALAGALIAAGRDSGTARTHVQTAVKEFKTASAPSDKVADAESLLRRVEVGH